MQTRTTGFDRIWRLFRRSPENGKNDTKNYQQHIDMLCDQARSLCSDPWLANQIAVSIDHQGDEYSFHASPAEGLPYIRAANSILGEKLPKEVGTQFKTASSR